MHAASPSNVAIATTSSVNNLLHRHNVLPSQKPSRHPLLRQHLSLRQRQPHSNQRVLNAMRLQRQNRLNHLHQPLHRQPSVKLNQHLHKLLNQLIQSPTPKKARVRLETKR